MTEQTQDRNFNHIINIKNKEKGYFVDHYDGDLDGAGFMKLYINNKDGSQKTVTVRASEIVSIEDWA